MASAGLGLDGLPMGGNAAGLAPEIPEAAIAPDVALRVLRMAMDGDATEFVIGPDASRAPAQGAVATRSGFGRGRKAKPDRSTVARTTQRKRLFFIHGSISLPVPPRPESSLPRSGFGLNELPCGTCCLPEHWYVRPDRLMRDEAPKECSLCGIALPDLPPFSGPFAT